MSNPSNKAEALILEFDGQVDAYGEPLMGFYWQRVGPQGEQLSGMMGPYNTGPEAEAAARRAFERGEY